MKKLKNLKSQKTPLRYPGGKSRACKKTDPYFPNLDDCVEFREPFLGGGSVALHVTKKYPHLKITVNDLYEPLVNFWVTLQTFGTDLTDKLRDYKSTHPEPVSAKELFLNSKEVINKSGVESIERAAAFYIVNKCSFSGLTESSSFSAQASSNNFSMISLTNIDSSLVCQNPLIEIFSPTSFSLQRFFPYLPSFFLINEDAHFKIFFVDR